eukprot:8921934-Heterocapsa_arctica.AAC.1
MSRKEALDIIKEKRKPPDLYIVMEVDVNNAEERIFFRFYRDCGIKHYASFLDHTKCMKRVAENSYTHVGNQYREHSEEIKATIVESIMGLGAIFAEYRYKELEDLP